jgi:uncharacterized NAD-dependent epimerase/dehydratase family protein
MKSPQRRYAILADGMLSQHTAKTAYGVLRYGRDTTVAVIDAEHAGRTMREVAPALGSAVPVVATLEEALTFQPTSLLIGVATTGGYYPPHFRAPILEAIDRGIEIVSGLHDLLGDDPEVVERAARSGAKLWDVRVPPTDLSVFTGAAYDVPQTVVTAVGSDCAVGKMSVMLEIERVANASSPCAEFVATGQTGILIAGKGIAVDRVISDFVAGAAERLVTTVDPRMEVTLVEGQGSIYHPAYAAVTFGLVLGSAPDYLVLVHDASRDSIEGFTVPIPSLRKLIDEHEAYLRRIKPATCVAVALNTSRLSDEEARAVIARTERETGLPATDALRYGASPLWDAIERARRAAKKRYPVGATAPASS